MCRSLPGWRLRPKRDNLLRAEPTQGKQLIYLLLKPILFGFIAVRSALAGDSCAIRSFMIAWRVASF
jgi:hypothetical protein